MFIVKKSKLWNTKKSSNSKVIVIKMTAMEFMMIHKNKECAKDVPHRHNFISWIGQAWFK